MTDGENIGATRLVLEPASLAVYVARNLSPWYHDVPDIDVLGRLPAVKVSCVNKNWIKCYIISQIVHTFWLVLIYDQLEDKRIYDVINIFVLFL